MTVLLDPTSERSPTIRSRLPRPESLDGRKIGILDIAKPRGDVFLKRLGERLAERGIAVRHYAKPTNTRVTPLPLRQQIAGELDLVIEGLSDRGSCISCCTHDVADLEERGIPTVGVATTEFIEGAAAQATSLGIDPALVFVPHPIQDRTDDELKKLADNNLDAILVLLVKT